MGGAGCANTAQREGPLWGAVGALGALAALRPHTSPPLPHGAAVLLPAAMLLAAPYLFLPLYLLAAAILGRRGPEVWGGGAEVWGGGREGRAGGGPEARRKTPEAWSGGGPEVRRSGEAEARGKAPEAWRGGGGGGPEVRAVGPEAWAKKPEAWAKKKPEVWGGAQRLWLRFLLRLPPHIFAAVSALGFASERRLFRLFPRAKPGPGRSAPLLPAPHLRSRLPVPAAPPGSPRPPPSLPARLRALLWGGSASLWGRLTPLWGRLAPLWGRSASPLWGTALWGRSASLRGRLAPLWGRLASLWGRALRFWGGTPPLWGRTPPLWGRGPKRPLWGPAPSSPPSRIPRLAPRRPTAPRPVAVAPKVGGSGGGAPPRCPTRRPWR